MSIELRLLAYSVALLFVLVLFQANAGMQGRTPAMMLGNRDDLPPPSAAAGRALRAVDNLRENLWFFAPLVLIAAAMNISNDWTVLGARLFFYGRVAHALTYLIGIAYVRTLAWLVSVIGCVLIFLALFGVLA